MAKIDFNKFPPEVCHYNPQVDISEVSQFDIVDIHKVFLESSLPEDAATTDSQYDGNEEPESIIGKPANAFDVVHMQQTVNELSKDKPSE